MASKPLSVARLERRRAVGSIQPEVLIDLELDRAARSEIKQAQIRHGAFLAALHGRPDPEHDWRREMRKEPCFYCKAPGGTIDHVLPRGRGGADHPANCVPCCRQCNHMRKDALTLEWLLCFKPENRRAPALRSLLTEAERSREQELRRNPRVPSHPPTPTAWPVAA